MSTVTHKDVLAALVPVGANFTLSQINEFLGIIGTLLGIVYLLWKWSRELKKK